MTGKTNAQVASFYVTLFGSGANPSPPKTKRRPWARPSRLRHQLHVERRLVRDVVRIQSDRCGHRLQDGERRSLRRIVRRDEQHEPDCHPAAAKSQRNGGVIHSSNNTLRSGANSLFSAVNELGDIIGNPSSPPQT